MKQKTLLEKAKEVKTIQSVRLFKLNQEELEVVVAFMNRDITWKQAQEVLPFLKTESGAGGNYGKIVTILRGGVESGKIKIIAGKK